MKVNRIFQDAVNLKNLGLFKDMVLYSIVPIVNGQLVKERRELVKDREETRLKRK